MKQIMKEDRRQKNRNRNRNRNKNMMMVPMMSILAVDGYSQQNLYTVSPVVAESERYEAKQKLQQIVDNN